VTRSLTLGEIARTLGAEFAVTASHYDETGDFPHDNFRRLHQAGLLALTAAAAHGGRGAGLSEAATVVGEIARGEPSTALILAMQYINLAALPGKRWPEAVALRVLSDAATKGALINALRVEADLGTPLRGGLPATTARRTGDGWSISGRKIYSTGVAGLSWWLVWARTDEDEPRVGLFLTPVDAPGLSIEETWNPLGMRATASHDAILNEAPIPLDHAVDLRAPAEWGERDAEQAVWMAVLIGSLYDGVARAARDWLLKFLHERKPANLGAPLATAPRLQQAVGEIEELLTINARVLRSAARDADAGEPPAPGECNLLKLAVTENAISAVEKALKLCGNHGVSRHNPLERHYRNVLCARIHSPQEDMVRIAAGRAALQI
jgi:alkylation response protein AidB-like acyl-CoA dehydrogenase